MACFHPITAWQLEDKIVDGIREKGAIVFSERGNVRREIKLPCYGCIGCRRTRRGAWAVRCLHESKLHASNVYVTLTYDDSHYNPSLNYVDFQLFMKRLRKAKGCVTNMMFNGRPIWTPRFFVGGEYGDDKSRPHFHCLLFGVDFPDKKVLTKNKYGHDLFRSAELEKLWPFGFSSFGAVTVQSAAYCAKYTMEKQYGDVAADYYKRVNLQTGEIVDVVPEFGRMSLRPGIGYPWFQKYWKDVYAARDGVIVEGKKVPPPRYYDRLLEEMVPLLKDEKEFDRYLRGLKFLEDSTPDRLAAREMVEQAKYRLSHADGVF